MAYTPTEWSNNNPKLTPELMNKLENGVAAASAKADLTEEEVDEINSNLGDYNLDNRCVELGQGYCNFSGSDNSFVWVEQDSTFVGTKSPINCVSGNIIKVKFDVTNKNIVIQWNNGTYSRVDNEKEIVATVPSGVTKFCMYCATSGLTPQTVGHIGIYVDNEIDVLNNSLDQLEFGENSGGSTVSETSEIKDGYYADGDGTILDNTSFWRTEKYSLAVKPMTTYTINLDVGCVYSIWFVDSSKKNIERVSGNSKNNFYFTTPENAEYLNISGQKNNGTPSKIWLNDGTESKEYEPFIPSVKMIAEEQTKQNASLEVLGKCKNMLKPTLGTTTVNGVTCTDNGDGTYTLNGTASSSAVFPLLSSSFYNITQYNGKFMVGCPSGGSKTEYGLVLSGDSSTPSIWDIGNGIELNISDSGRYRLVIYIASGVTISNLVFKPMITTNLNATYDDFVPYTGDGNTLTADVADLKDALDKLNSLPKGSIIQIEADKDDTETTTQKYGWQYLGTSNIQYENGSTNLLVTNVYRKNN